MLLLFGLAVRLVPATFSPMPYNIDGFPLVKISENIIQNQGHNFSSDVSLIDYNSKMPVFSLLLATFSLFTGVPSLQLVQFFVPLITISTIVMIYFITFKITKNQSAAFFAGMILAFNGLFVYLTSAAMKQTIGMTLIPLIVYLYHGRSSPKKRFLAMGLLLLMPLVHHLSTIIVFIMVTVMLFSENILSRASLRRSVYDFLTGPILFAFAFLYYRMVNLYHVTKVSNFNDIVLLMSVLILFLTLSMILSKEKSRRIIKYSWANGGLIAFLVCLGWLVANTQIKIFGVLGTPNALLVHMIPYMIMALFAIYGFGLVRHTKTPHKTLIVTLCISPFIMMSFAVLSGLDPFTSDLAFRSYDFVDFGLAICGGIGVVYAYNTLKKINLNLARAAVVAFTACCLLTLPLAYNVTEFSGIRSVTPSHDFAACEHASGLQQVIYTDQRLADIISPYFSAKSVKSTPLIMDEGKTLSNKVVMADQEWTSRGAHMYPLDNIVIDRNYFDDLLNDNNLIYIGGPEGDLMYIVGT